MIETPNSAVDVDELMAELRRELAAAPDPAQPELAPLQSGPPAADLRWLEFLNVAERHAAVGGEVPPFNRYGPIKRRLARLVARPILYAAELVTHQQRTFNTMLLAALREFADRVHALEQELAVQSAQRAASVRTPAQRGGEPVAAPSEGAAGEPDR